MAHVWHSGSCRDYEYMTMKLGEVSFKLVAHVWHSGSCRDYEYMTMKLSASTNLFSFIPKQEVNNNSELGWFE